MSSDLEEFGQRIEALRRYHQEMAATLYLERLARDTRLLSEGLVAGTPWARRAGRQALRWVVDRLSCNRQSAPSVSDSVIVEGEVVAPTVIVIKREGNDD